MFVAIAIVSVDAKRKRRKNKDDGSGKCEGNPFDPSGSEDKDFTCAACRYVVHEIQTAATDSIRKKHTKDERVVFAEAALGSVCGLIAKRKMAQMGQK